MKKNFAPILVVAFAMAAICTAIFYRLIAGRLGTEAQANAAPQILVAARDIHRGSQVATGDLKLVPWAGGAPEGALRAASQASGLTAIAEISAGEPVTASRIASKGSGGSLGVPAGMRAISVQVHDSSGVVGLLKPGFRVDVQAVYSRSGASADSELRTVLENIEVLKINPVAEPAPGRPPLPVATLLVTPPEADVVGLADAIARVRLVLRNPLDQEKAPRGALGVAGLMRGGGAGALPPHLRPAASAAHSTAPAPPLVRPSGGGISLATANPPSCDPPKAAAEK